MNSAPVSVPVCKPSSGQTDSLNGVHRVRSLTETTRKMVMLGIEILAHQEKEVEGLEDYVMEGRANSSCVAKTFNVLRWIIWMIAIVLNFADPIVSLVAGIRNVSLGQAVIWLSSFAILMSIIFSFSIRVVLSIACLVINVVLRLVAYHLRYGYSAYNGSRMFSLISFCSLGAVLLFEMIDETRNSCK
ncbi:hypothetical protein WA538_005434 [Blastocystis sp. DL]